MSLLYAPWQIVFNELKKRGKATANRCKYILRQFITQIVCWFVLPYLIGFKSYTFRNHRRFSVSKRQYGRLNSFRSRKGVFRSFCFSTEKNGIIFSMIIIRSIWCYELLPICLSSSVSNWRLWAKVKKCKVRRGFRVTPNRCQFVMAIKIVENWNKKQKITSKAVVRIQLVCIFSAYSVPLASFAIFFFIFNSEFLALLVIRDYSGVFCCFQFLSVLFVNP